jgi:hypothetical protein
MGHFLSKGIIALKSSKIPGDHRNSKIGDKANE